MMLNCHLFLLTFVLTIIGGVCTRVLSWDAIRTQFCLEDNDTQGIDLSQLIVRMYRRNINQILHDSEPVRKEAFAILDQNFRLVYGIPR